MKVVVELSGGADSALAAVYAVRRHVSADFYALFINYGQDYLLQERRASEEVFKFLNKQFGGWHWKEVTISKFWNTGAAVEEYVPLRNLVLGAISASYAQSIGATVVVNGSKSLEVDFKDPYSFRDSTLGFYKKLEDLVCYATETNVKKVTVEPLLAMHRSEKMTKKSVYSQLSDIGIKETWSCFHPNAGGHECGTCKNCKERAAIGVAQ